MLRLRELHAVRASMLHASMLDAVHASIRESRLWWYV